MKSVPLTAYPRTLSRRGGSKKLRASGRVPAVIYGRLNQPKSLEIKIKDIETLIHHSVSENLLVDLVVDAPEKTKHLALVQEVQHHPLSGKVLHVDLHEVAENETVTIMVPVEAVGEAVGVKSAGGVLEHVLFKLKVRALPKDLPEVISVDVSNLQIGQSIHIGDLVRPPGVEIMGDKAISVLAVAAPVTEAQETAAEAAAAGPAEVEMIKEKKEDGETAKAPAAGGKAAPAEKAGEKKPAEKKK
ncbi:MAG: 50S ribosomal protein L25 [Opitutaceae bacterium]|nr:50S ribosomal protein L25 [Verrucomicrobiales bacterium]